MRTIQIGCFCIMLFFGNTIRVHAQAFKQGDITVSAGYGFPSLTRTIFSVVEGTNVSTSFAGPIFGKFEYAVNDYVGFGINTAFTHGSAHYNTTDDTYDSILYNEAFNYTSYSILARLNFHFGKSEMFDPYAGIGLGYRNTNYAYESDNPTFEGSDINSPFHFGVDFTLGTRFYFTENIGIYGEVGIAKSPLQAGLIVKF